VIKVQNEHLRRNNECLSPEFCMVWGCSFRDVEFRCDEWREMYAGLHLNDICTWKYDGRPGGAVGPGWICSHGFFMANKWMPHALLPLKLRHELHLQNMLEREQHKLLETLRVILYKTLSVRLDILDAAMGVSGFPNITRQEMMREFTQHRLELLPYIECWIKGEENGS
jgi:hypothetical protein